MLLRSSEGYVYRADSEDYGKTWSEPCEMVVGDVSGGRGPVRNKPISLSNRSVVAGGSIEKGIWSAFVDVSTDGCVTWKKSAPIEIAGLMYNAGEKTAESNIAVSEQSFYGRGVIQPSLWESAAGKVHMLLRSSEGYVYRADSEDYGKTWSDAYKTELPNNNSGLDLVKAPFDGNLYLVCNPVQANWGMRSPLSLFKSEDNGVTWSKLYDLESEPGEFSYPAIIASEEGLIITYTWNRKTIACVEISCEELR
jgi:predicted neuraminidase